MCVKPGCYYCSLTSRKEITSLPWGGEREGADVSSPCTRFGCHMCPVSVFHPHTPTILFIFLFGGPSNKTRTSFSVQCIQKSEIRQKWSVYIDVYDENDENSFVNYENNPYRALCYMFSSCDADRETITGGICVPVWPVNAFSSACIAHLLTAIWGSYTPRAWHVNKRHPSTNTIKEYTVYISNGHIIGFTLVWLLLTHTFG